MFLSFYVIVDGINIWIKQTLFPSDSKTAAKTIKYRKFLSCDLYRTRGDGNCLYRACSKLLCGKEDLCDLLRDLTSIELFSNQEFYAFHPYVKEKSHVFQSDNTAFSATASDSALGDGYDRKDPSSRVTVVKREAIRNATGGTYASLMCVFGLSSVTGIGVTSVYPEKVGQETKYSQFQNGTVWPRLFHSNVKSKLVQEAKLILMWTTLGIHILPGMSKGFQPNHFVPLVELMAKDVEKNEPQQQKITDLFRSKSKQMEEGTSEGKYSVDIVTMP